MKDGYDNYEVERLKNLAQANKYLNGLGVPIKVGFRFDKDKNKKIFFVDFEIYGDYPESSYLEQKDKWMNHKKE